MSDRSGAVVGYRPVLDVARGATAGYQVVARHDLDTVGVVRTGLVAASRSPGDTFIAIPLPLDRQSDPAVRQAFADHGDLTGIVLDITDFRANPDPLIREALENYRRAGAVISVGGTHAAQPELKSIVDLRPGIIRLGRNWISDVDRSPAKRSAIEVTGDLACQLDAAILTEGISSAAELDALASLGVPLAQGPFIGDVAPDWPKAG